VSRECGGATSGHRNLAPLPGAQRFDRSSRSIIIRSSFLEHGEHQSLGALCAHRPKRSAGLMRRTGWGCSWTRPASSPSRWSSPAALLGLGVDAARWVDVRPVQAAAA